MCSRYFLLNDVFLMNRDMRRIEIANEFADFKSIQSQTFEERRPGEQADGLIIGLGCVQCDGDLQIRAAV